MPAAVSPTKQKETYMITFGFEKEFFTKNNQGYCLATSLSHDDCGYLAEARGDPSPDPVVAKYLFLASQEKLYASAAKLKITLEDIHTATLPKAFLRDTMRRFGKNAARSRFMSGKPYHSSAPRAGLHIHFGSLREVYHDGKLVCKVPEIIDIPRIVYVFDQAFAKEIKEAKRRSGEYELKHHGFEYRSLPSTVNLDKVVSVLHSLSTETHYTSSDETTGNEG